MSLNIASVFVQVVLLRISGWIADLVPFSALPLFGPEAGGTIVKISYSFWSSNVTASGDLPGNVHVVLHGQELAITMM